MLNELMRERASGATGVRNLSAYQDVRRKRWSRIQQVQGAPTWWLSFLIGYKKLSPADCEWGQGDKNFERVENFEVVTWKTWDSWSRNTWQDLISFTSGPIFYLLPSFPLLPPSHQWLKMLTCLHLKHTKPSHNPKSLSNYCLLPPPFQGQTPKKVFDLTSLLFLFLFPLPHRLFCISFIGIILTES